MMPYSVIKCLISGDRTPRYVTQAALFFSIRQSDTAVSSKGGDS